MILTDEIRNTIRSQLTAVPEPSQNPTRRREISGYRYNGGRAFDSDALGVNPVQVKEANEQLRRHGCLAEYQPDGTLRVSSEKQFHQAAAIAGLRTGRDGYFGGYDENYQKQYTGREVEKRKKEFEQKVLNGEIDLF